MEYFVRGVAACWEEGIIIINRGCGSKPDYVGLGVGCEWYTNLSVSLIRV